MYSQFKVVKTAVDKLAAEYCFFNKNLVQIFWTGGVYIFINILQLRFYSLVFCMFCYT